MLFNVDRLKEAFSYPINHALQMRELYLPFYKKRLMAFSIEGTIDANIVDEHIIDPLLRNTGPSIEADANFVTTIMKSVLTTGNAKDISTFSDAIKDLLNGNTILIIDGEAKAISIDTAKFENRSVAEPSTETVIKGPKAAFIESVAINRSLLRKQLRDPNLMCEFAEIGEHAPQQVSIMYLKNIADPSIVEDVKKRLNKIRTDSIITLSTLEQHIEERPYSIIPSTLETERPDRTVAFLQEGHVVLLMENSPTALVVPITFWSLFHTVEDQYLRMAYGNFIRMIRFISLLLALFTPSFYIAVTTYHSEMIPTDLMLAITASRERIPFPIFFEILIMEVTFEILREAGVRVPNTLGTTIGIVGALILGQAAVQANLVSPILVIIVAITGLASFTIPDISMNIAVRMLRFTFLFVTFFLGFFGFSITLAFLIAYLVSIKSFGVPFLAPLSPHFPSSKDLLLRPPAWKQWLRPFSTSPKDKVRSPKPEGNAES
ncbi:spore germination protein [Bacillus sp. FJAT-50079]|nr:spore germination protein [Bacillus sp. FJAT-50079]MBS4210266.1 spore germination protein [Bacillus sp. FJAT-50079]